MQRADDEARAQLPERGGKLRVDPHEPVPRGLGPWPPIAPHPGRIWWKGVISGGFGRGIGKFGQARKEIAEQLPASHLYSIDWDVGMKALFKVRIFFALSVTSIFKRMHVTLNISKKIN
jgi:hypothetical protein